MCCEWLEKLVKSGTKLQRHCLGVRPALCFAEFMKLSLINSYIINKKINLNELKIPQAIFLLVIRSDEAKIAPLLVKNKVSVIDQLFETEEILNFYHPLRRIVKQVCSIDNKQLRRVETF